MKSFKKYLVTGLILASLAPLGGCVSTVVGAGAAVGVAALEERSFKVHAEDTTLAAKIRFNLVDSGKKYITGVGVEVFESNALLTGLVKDEHIRAEILQLAWKVEGIRDVYNELQIAESSISDLAKDSWVTTQLKSKITFDEDILAINYSIETVAGTVYLIGIAQNQAELDKVVSHARNLGYVKRVISHVRVKQAAS